MDHQAFAQLLGNYGEFIGAVAVVITLIYLAAQIRQNTRAVRLSTAHSIAEAFRDQYSTVGGSGQVAEVYSIGFTRPGELDQAQGTQFYALLHQTVRVYEEAYYQFAQGALDERLWTGMHRQMLYTSSQPGFTQYWQERHDWYNESFQDYMNGVLIPGAMHFSVGGMGKTAHS